MRNYNFAPGPAALPLPVLEQAQRELVEHGKDGMSVMEMSHRSSMFESIFSETRSSLCRLMNISDEYEVLFLQGGATLQFAQVPMNLMQSGKADYVVSGSFSKKAADEAQKYGDVHIAASSADRNFTYIPATTRDLFRPDADYVHIATNNTIYGTSCRTHLPDTGSVPLVADMSSNILSEVYDINRFGLIYAGAQKNIGPAGLTLVIIRKDLIRDPIADYVPTLLSYKTMAKNGSMYNTPPTYGIYMAGLVFQYLESIGGIPAIQKINEEKAALLYDALDQSALFTPTAEKDARSLMNVTFVTPSKDLDAQFVAEAAEIGLVNLKGHRSVGGMRASIYNAMPKEGVAKLAQFVEDFDKKHA